VTNAEQFSFDGSAAEVDVLIKLWIEDITLLNLVVVRKDEVAKYPYRVSYTIDAPSLSKIDPAQLKQGDTDKEITLTGESLIKAPFQRHRVRQNKDQRTGLAEREGN
jgi:hypothetical protein